MKKNFQIVLRGKCFGNEKFSLFTNRTMDSYQELKCQDLTSDVVMQVAEKKVLHFSDGILEVDDVKTHKEMNEEILVDPQKLSWAPWMWYYTTFAGSKALQVCDYLGEFFATFFGITTPKYQYEITEYNRMKKEEEENKRIQLDKSNNWSLDDAPRVTVTGGHTDLSREEFQLKSVTCIEPETKC